MLPNYIVIGNDSDVHGSQLQCNGEGLQRHGCLRAEAAKSTVPNYIVMGMDWEIRVSQLQCNWEVTLETKACGWKLRNPCFPIAL